MLDIDTRRRIDSARDILVGKVPDPKSQVEQITIALIYKFMDDMDAESEEFGGERKFFAGEFARYGWAKLMRSGLGGHEILNLYAEAIAKMPENPGIPPLFRDIFNNAYLPYRDPETLRAFLKVIGEFTYDHSERLGDAFEYLLSVLGSQGDAGQFRTPRHIIDFIVEVIDPKKHETILDPACGTAGFLISSYKHILAANPSCPAKDSDSPSCSSCPSMLPSSLTPDEKGRLAQNFKGYDISPDMVRLSQVNMYLHGFVDPHIYEYDTLTSQERWSDYADVILANPPFMSPKGGIRPHNRFSVQSKRSEVLFVDYMAEHLTPTGRAGIIVPEGIIFQSQTAYAQLRKMLVEKYLVAVVSLPAGVFNPYSGVKTSILILDKSLANKATTIAFFKVENDGFGLGAQRREIGKNDLPQVQDEIAEYLYRLRTNESIEDYQPALGLIVTKEKIAVNGDYNLNGERYREEAPKPTNYPWRMVGTLVETITPPLKIQKTAFGESGRFPIIDQSQDAIAGWTDDESALVLPTKPFVVFGDHTCAVKLIDTPFAQGADGIKILRTIDTLNPHFLYYVLRDRPLESDGYQRHFSKLREREIPLPPLEVQKEIVAEIEGYQKIIDGARAVVENYRPQIPIDPDWPMVELSKLVNNMHQGINTAGLKIQFAGKGFPIIQARNITSGTLDFNNVKYMSLNDWNIYRDKYKPHANDVLFSNIGTIGKSIVIIKEDDYLIHWNIFIIKLGDKLNSFFLKYYLDHLESTGFFKQFQRGGTVQFISKQNLSTTHIPLPPLTTQQAIVAEIEAEQALVEANRKLIARFERKIQAILARIWGEDEPTPEEA